MPGLIKAEDIATVKERSAIEEVVGEHVTLRRRGANQIGLCPFHDERTPSFNVNPGAGFYHCFGCGKSGDVINFVMEVDHLTFAEAVERLAARIGMELRYEQGERPGGSEGGLGRRMRLVEAHRVAQEFYHQALVHSAEGRAGRDFLRGRGFVGVDAQHFGIGYAPKGFDVLADHLRDKGFADDELVTAGLVGRSSGGRIYDRFRGRVVWPIRDVTGDTIGFGARRIYDDDRIEAKYLNTAETPIYKKTHVLYGLDLAKKSIAKDRKAVVVEGYTDVMACHLAGVTQAVATCGTAFGAEHVRTLRRILRDASDQAPPTVVFTFDGDAAGQAAAMKAFQLNSEWGAQSFVAVAPGGQDPCDLRQTGQDEAVRELVADAQPILTFVLGTTLRRFDLETPDGRVLAMRAVAPLLAAVHDTTLRREYVDEVVGRIGVAPERMLAEIDRAAHQPVAARGTPEPQAPVAEPAATGVPMPDTRNPVVQAEQQFLELMTQFPSRVPGRLLGTMSEDDFAAPAHREIFAAMLRVGAPAGRSLATWLDGVHEELPLELRPLIARYAVARLPTKLDPATGAPDQRYAKALIVRVRQSALRRRIDESIGQMRRLAGDPQERMVAAQVQQMQQELAELGSSVE